MVAARSREDDDVEANPTPTPMEMKLSSPIEVRFWLHDAAGFKVHLPLYAGDNHRVPRDYIDSAREPYPRPAANAHGHESGSSGGSLRLPS